MSARKMKLPANEVDKHLGARLRAARLAAKMSQKRLGDALGVSFQQCGKYESGENRISAATLYVAAGVLERPLEFFFAEEA